MPTTRSMIADSTSHVSGEQLEAPLHSVAVPLQRDSALRLPSSAHRPQEGCLEATIARRIATPPTLGRQTEMVQFQHTLARHAFNVVRHPQQQLAGNWQPLLLERIQPLRSSSNRWPAMRLSAVFWKSGSLAIALEVCRPPWRTSWATPARPDRRLCKRASAARLLLLWMLLESPYQRGWHVAAVVPQSFGPQFMDCGNGFRRQNYRPEHKGGQIAGTVKAAERSATSRITQPS